MSQNSDTKMYVALGVLALLGGGYFMHVNGEKRQSAEHSLEAAAQKMPAVAMTEEDSNKITKVVIEKPATEGENPKPAEKNVLVKDGDTWKLQEPVKALANQKSIESLLENLTKFEIKEQVSSTKDSYKQYEVDDEKGLHATFYEGDKVVREIWAGKSGGRGQMARIGGSDGVYILGGYSGYLYSRDTKGWRDLSILELDPEEATAVTIVNEQGEFSFKKAGEEWEGTFKKAKGSSAAKIADFESKKVKDLLNAYKKLNASGFGDGKTLADTGLETPSATLTIERGESSPVVIHFGSNAEGSSRFAKLPDGQQIYSISSWASDWAFAEEKKFQKAKAGEEEGSDDEMPGGMPPGMQMPPGMGMPTGHP